jgi:hypothetical protein
MAIRDVTKSPYTAVADSSTDNWATIQSAINDCDADGGGTVYIPASKHRYYNISQSLTLGSSVKLVGDGAGSVVQQTTVGENVVEVVSSGGIGLTVDTTASGGVLATAVLHSGGGGTGYRIGDTSSIIQAGGSGGTVRISAVAGGVVTYVVLISTGAGYANTGTALPTGAASHTDVMVSDILLFGYGNGYGLFAQNTSNLEMQNVWAQGEGGNPAPVTTGPGAGFLFDNVTDSVITGCTADQTIGSGFRIAGPAWDTEYSNCVAFYSGYDNNGSPLAGSPVYGFDLVQTSISDSSKVSANHWFMRHCETQLVNGIGFHINSDSVTLTDCVATQSKLHGFLIGDQHSVKDVSLHGCRSASNSQTLSDEYDGFNIQQAIRLKLHDCVVDGGAHHYGLNVGTGVSGMEIFGGHFENAAGLVGAGVGWVDQSSGAFLIGAEFEPRMNVYPVGWTLAEIIGKAQSRIDQLTFQPSGKFSFVWWTDIVNSVQQVAASEVGYKRTPIPVNVLANTQVSTLPPAMCKNIRAIWIGGQQVEIKTDFEMNESYRGWRQVSGFPNQPLGDHVATQSTSIADVGTSYTITGFSSGVYTTITGVLVNDIGGTNPGPSISSAIFDTILSLTLATPCVGSVTVSGTNGAIVTLAPGQTATNQGQPFTGAICRNNDMPRYAVLDPPNIYWYPIPTAAYTATVFTSSMPVDLVNGTDQPDSFQVAYQDILVNGAAAMAELGDLYSSSQNARENMCLQSFWNRLNKSPNSLAEFINAMSADRQKPIGIAPEGNYQDRFGQRRRQW